MKKLLAVLLFALLPVSLFAGSLSGHAAKGSAVVLESGNVELSTGKATMSQAHMAFIPALLVVQAGTTVTFTNNDPAPHNVYWPSINGNKALKHNLGTFGNGQSASFRFTVPGVVPILCSLHPDMHAMIIVSPSPYFGAADSILGDYFIMNVPDGTYKATLYVNGKAAGTKSVVVKGNSKLDF